MMKRTVLRTATAALTVLLLGGCMSARLATLRPMDDLAKPDTMSQTATAAGYTDSNGVPTLAERFQKRPGLKVAVLQYAYFVQGDDPVEYSDYIHVDKGSLWNTITTHNTVLPGLTPPYALGVYLALDGEQKLEAALKDAGFDVIPLETVTQTKAYQAAYGDYPPYTTATDDFHSGWCVFSPALHVKPIEGWKDYAFYHFVWPDTAVLKQIQAELGQDVLFLTVLSQFEDHERRTEMTEVDSSTNRFKKYRTGEFSGYTKVVVNDPQYVGYGIGGFGHIVSTYDMRLTPPSPRPDFIKNNDDGSFETDWMVLAKDAKLTNTYYAKGIAAVMKERREGKK